MKKKIFSVLFALVLVASLGLVTAVPVAANGTPDHYVSLTGSNVSPYETLANAANKIQDAIGVAVTGDKVHVAVGTYNEDITLKNEVQVLGAGEASTTINGTGTGSVVTASGVGPTTKLDGFTVTGGDTNTTGGGGMYIVNSSLTVSNCTFDSNTASGTGIPSGVGGGMHNLNSSPTITNCTFSGNTAGQPGAGMCNNNSSPTITNCTFFGNETTFGGGGMYNRNGGTPTVTDCTFYNNTGSYGAGMYNYDSPATVTNCTFYSNAGQDGGGMYDSNSSSEVTNCIFYGNRASGRGGGMFIRDSSPTVTNCTFSGNSAYYYGGAIFSQHLSTATVTNCILWGDSVQVHEGPEIYDYVDPTFPSVTTVNYSDVQGGWPGTGNIEAYPYFSNPFAGDYHLESDSPCINAGSNAAVPVWLTTDFEGDDRIIGAAVDMGADEFLPHEVWVVITGSDTNPGTWSLPFATIQMGIDTVAEGGTVNVAAGIYDEQVVINKALTLQGTGDTTGIQPSGPELIPTTSIPWINAGTGTMSAIVSVETTGDEVTIRDLEIDGSLITSKSTTWVAGLVYLETSGKIEGVTVNGGSTLPDRTAGIFAAAIGEPAILEVTGCTVEVYTRAGIYALGGQLTADYHHNEINGPGSISTGVPNGMFFLEGVNGSATYNTVTDLGYTGVGEYRSTGIGTYNAGTDVTFAYNTISYVQNAFALSTGTIGTIVEYNNIFNNHTGVRIEANAASSIIQYNDIHDNDFAIRCGATMGDGNVAHYNNFVNNPGLEWTNLDEAEPNTYVGAVCNVHLTSILDATNNWWGDATGPKQATTNPSATGDEASDNVNYTPWLDATYPGGSERTYNVENTDTFDTFNSIQAAIDAAAEGNTINVAAGIYDPASPIVVDESVILTGDVATPSNVVVNAPTTEGLYDRDCFQVIANNVTIQGFRIVGAQDWREGDVGDWSKPGRQNAGIMVGSEATLTTLEPNVYRGISGGTFSYNEFVDCSKGIFMYHVKGTTVSYNTFTTTEGQNPDNFYDTMGWNGDGVHVYLEVASDYPTGNNISHNTMDNVRVGVFLNGDTIGGTDPSAWDFSGTTIEDNTMTNVWNAGIILQCASGTAESPITININDINTSTGRRAGDEGNERGLISVHGDYTVITGNTLTNSEEHGLWVDGSHHTVTGNIVTSNTLDGIHAGAYKKTEPNNNWTLPVITRADITISTNTLENVGLEAAAIFGEFIDSIAILGNTITDFTKGGIVVKNVLLVQIEGNIISTTDHSVAPNGIQIGYVTDLTSTTGTVNDNQVSGCSWDGYDPLTETYEGDWTGSGILVIAPDSALEISGNEVQSCDVGLDIETGPDTFMANNDVHDNSYGFVLWNAAPTISFNNIYQNALGGVYRTTDGSLEGILDATNNWWGSASGPTHASNTYTVPAGDAQGNAVSDLVDFVPWLDALYDMGVSFAPVENTDTGEQFSSIQGAIDDASDFDTVIVAEGIYDEYVDIGISLILSGQPGAIVKPSTTNDWPIIGINADGVTVKGFEVDGTGLTPEVWAGIGSWSGCTSVTIKDNTVHDIANTVDSGVGISLWRGGSDAIYEDILIEGNIVYNTDRMGIYIGAMNSSYDKWLLSASNTIRGNVVYNTMLNPNVGETFPIRCGGIAVDAAKNCTIEGNTVYNTANTMPGIFLAHGSGAGNQISSNEVYSQAYGIAVEIDRGDVDFGTDLPAAPEVHFNNIYDNGEYGLIVFNAVGEEVDATNNWWGDASGPYHATTNPDATGNEVSDNVVYDPWIGAKVKVEETESGDDTVNATDNADTTVLKKGSGTPTITVTEYTDNPGDGAPGGFSSAGKYIDVHIDNTTDVTEIEIRNYYTLADIAGLNEETLKLSWWDGTAWVECSDSGATYPLDPALFPEYRGYVWAKIRETGAIPSTIPTLDDLAGTPFMSMAIPAPAAGGGFVPPAPTVTTNLFGAAGIFSISGTGEIQEAITATSVDGNLTMTIPAGTIALDKDGNPLISLTAAVDPSPPPPPEGAHIIGLAYKFEPAGATFDPPLTLEYTYDPADIPEGVAEGDLVLAFYIEGIPPEPGEWVELPCVVDPVTHRIIATVSHFTTFAIIAHIPPPAPAAFSLSNLTVQPAEVQPKEAVTITASVANTGGTEGSYAVILKIDGVKEAEKSVTVAAGGSQTVTFSVTKEDAASYSVTVDGLSGSFTVVPPPPPPAAFSVSNLTVKPAEVQPGEAVRIEVALTNTGGTQGNYTVVLKINGVKEADRTVTIDAGATLNLIFALTKEAAGSYSVTVDGLSGSFTVVGPVTNWPLIGGIIGAVIVIGLLIFLLNFVRRRRA